MDEPNLQGQEPKPAPQGARRALGPILVIVSLIALLIALGYDSPAREVSEDEFWYHLIAGHLQETEITSPSQIDSVLTEPGVEAGATKIFVTVTDTVLIKERLREFQAREMESPISQNALLAENVVPLQGWSVRYLPKAEEGASTPPVVQRFFVEYADDSGQHYAEVLGGRRGTPDLPTLVTALSDASAPMEYLTFDAEGGLATKDQNSLLLFFLTTFGPILIIVALFWFIFMRQMRGQGQGLLSFGKSRALVYDSENEVKITFEDVAGIDEAKEEVGEIIQFLSNPEKFHNLGGRIPRGVLLVGSPGTGKTLLARAIAGEAQVPFLSISGSDFVEMFVGVGASRVRDLFKQAREAAPCIVFLDEIDAVGRKRGSGMGGGHDEREQTLNAILVEMDGFATDEGIILIAATNRPDVLDPALLRPGRFDREIIIDLPDVLGREKILTVHSTKIKMAEGVDLAIVARGTPGFSGAELAALVNEAAIAAAMKDSTEVTLPDFEEARDKVRFGREKRSRVLDPEDKRITAYHEAGHAVISSLLEHTEPIHKVTIIPRGMALGATMMLPEKDRSHLTRKSLLDEMTALYGGRVAEEHFCDDITAGAQNDIQRATHMAKLMVTEWGMSERLGAVNFADRHGSEFLGTELTIGRDHSDATVHMVDEEVRSLLETAHKRAREVLLKNEEAGERVAQALMRFETLLGDEVRQLIFDKVSLEDLRPAPEPPPVPSTA